MRKSPDSFADQDFLIIGMNEFLYIIKTIARAHKLVAGTLIILIALSFMVVGNAVPVVFSTLNSLYSPSGIDEQSLGVLHIENDASSDTTAIPVAVMNELRSTPGVLSVAAISGLPMQNMSLTFNPFRERGQNAVSKSVTGYSGSSEFMSLLGISLTSGRQFQQDEYTKSQGLFPDSKVVIISQDLADYLWPGEEPLGKVLIASDDHIYRVIGICTRVAETNPSSLADKQLVAFFPAIIGPNLSDTFVFRYAPDIDVDSLFAKVALRIHQVLPMAAYSRPRTFIQIRYDYFASEIRTAWMFGIICLVVVLTMALGVGGLAAYWLAQRRRSIAIKRSLGASRRHVVLYFVTENCVLSIVGVFIGTALALFANHWLLKHFEMQHVGLIYFLAGGLLFIFINLISIMQPLRRSIFFGPSQVFRS